MNPYLAKLRALNSKKHIPDELTKLTKPGSVSFVSDHSMRFSENWGPERGVPLAWPACGPDLHVVAIGTPPGGWPGGPGE